MIVAANLGSVGVDMHQPLRGSGNAEQRVALRRRLRHPPANQKNKIGRFDARFQLGIDREADFAGEILMLAVECARAPEGTGHGQVEAFGEPGKGGARPLGPSAAAENGNRALGRPEHLLQLGHLRKARPDRDRLGARGVRHGRHFRQHVLGQRDHDRARPALHRRVKRALDNFGDLRRGSRSASRASWSKRTKPDSPSPGRRPAPSSRARPGL